MSRSLRPVTVELPVFLGWTTLVSLGALAPFKIFLRLVKCRVYCEILMGCQECVFLNLLLWSYQA